MSTERCPSCGTPYEPDATFCINCGAKRVEVKPPTEEAETQPVTEPQPTAKVASEEEVLARLDKEVSAAPVEPKKRGQKKKGCCIAVVVVALVVGGAAACLVGIYGYNAGWFEGMSMSEGYSSDFSTLPAEEFDVWFKRAGAAVSLENGAVKVKNALLGVKYDAGADYEVSVRVAVAGAATNDAWAGPVLRVNAKGGDRYAFQLCPGVKECRIAYIPAKGKTRILVANRVEEIALGKWFEITATAEEQDLTMKLNGVVVGRTTYIGLAEGPAGLEAYKAMAYFDDLTIQPK